MIRITNINMPLSSTLDELKSESARRLCIPPDAIERFEIARKSIDARDKGDIHFVYGVDLWIADETSILKKSKCKSASIIAPYKEIPQTKRDFKYAPVVVGSGPAGLFAALTLAEAGARPIILERGDDVETRTSTVKRFWEHGELDSESNVQFGEGGAGTFSDGKLNTGTRDSRQRKVLQSFVDCGAPSEILYLAKPHIGTDHLYHVVKNLRGRILSLGGKVLFRHKLTAIIKSDNKLTGIEYITPDGHTQSMETDHLILAIGHSARDTFEMLQKSGVPMTQKAFSVGVRIEHPQALINRVQYGKFASHPALSSADYKLAVHLENGRSVYTFCICPGGVVVAAASECGGVVTNGMSYYARAGENANSALLVGVTPSDFESDDPLAGVAFQRRLERSAFQLGGSNYRAPAQTVEDFLACRASKTVASVVPSYLPGVTPTDLAALFPAEITESLQSGISRLDRLLHGFAMPDAVMTGVESRSSSPIRIVRGDNLESELHGLYPCGEGAGYAGGILSAAVDGIRVAEAILQK